MFIVLTEPLSNDVQHEFCTEYLDRDGIYWTRIDLSNDKYVIVRHIMQDEFDELLESEPEYKERLLKESIKIQQLLAGIS